MKVTLGELLLTGLVILGLAAIGAALMIFAPNFTTAITDYIMSFFNGNLTPVGGVAQ